MALTGKMARGSEIKAITRAVAGDRPIAFISALSGLCSARAPLMARQRFFLLTGPKGNISARRRISCRGAAVGIGAFAVVRSQPGWRQATAATASADTMAHVAGHIIGTGVK